MKTKVISVVVSCRKESEDSVRKDRIYLNGIQELDNINAAISKNIYIRLAEPIDKVELEFCLHDLACRLVELGLFVSYKLYPQIEPINDAIDAGDTRSNYPFILTADDKIYQTKYYIEFRLP